MLPREAESKLKKLARKFPVVGVTGPRQSGKTILVRSVFKNYEYYSLEDMDVRMKAIEDPRGFLTQHEKGMIIDEVQNVPELFSYLQRIVDENKKMGQFILTGSQNFMLLEKITQSLAGRVGLVQLLPFTLSELNLVKNRNAEDVDFWMYSGFYPPVYDRKIAPTDFYPQYIQTYVDRDVRNLKNIGDLNTFQKFVKLCSGRIGQLLNIHSLSSECGITLNTAKSWFSVLEASYILFFLQPHHRNFHKRLVKSPKLYFYDTGVACSLLGIGSYKSLKTHYLRGSLFENLIIAEYMKDRFNQGLPNNNYFWRDNIGNEVDLVIEREEDVIPIEIKSGQTLNQNFYDGLQYYCKLAKQELHEGILIYGGDKSFRSLQDPQTVSWKRFKKGVI